MSGDFSEPSDRITIEVDVASSVVEADGSLAIERDGQPIARMPRNGFYFDRLEKYPGAAHVEVAGYQPPLLAPEHVAWYDAQSRALFENTDLAIVAPLGPPYELFDGLGTGDFEAWMITLATEPDCVHALYETLTDAWLVNLQRFVDARAIGSRCCRSATTSVRRSRCSTRRRAAIPPCRRRGSQARSTVGASVLYFAFGRYFAIVAPLRLNAHRVGLPVMRLQRDGQSCTAEPTPPKTVCPARRSVSRLV